MHRSALLAAALPVLLSLCAVAAAAPVPANRTVLPAARVRDLAPLLRGADLALLQGDGKGMREITLLTLAAAPPQAVRDVVVHPERYAEFVRNMTLSTVKPQAGGGVDHVYELSYSLVNIGGTSRYVLLPPEPESGAGAVEMFDPEGGTRWHRWDFLAVPGGTVIILTGYTDVHHSGDVVDRLLARSPTLEYGLALIGQMTLLLAMKGRAEQLAGRPLPALSGNPSPDYSFLLDRGTLALFRNRAGRLSEMSLISRSKAAPGPLLDAAAQAAEWARFMPSITRSVDLGPVGGVPAVDLEQALPLISFRTSFGVHRSPGAVDMLGLSGDLRGARLRWDVRPAVKGSQVVLRSSEAFDRSSLVIRQLYKLEPLFEYGVNLGLNLVLLQGLLGRAGG